MDKKEYEDGTRVADSRTKVPEEYKLATHIEEQDAVYKFYRNPYAMGLGTVCNENINSVELSDLNPFENQNVLYSALCGKSEVTQYFTRIIPKDSDRLNLNTAKLNDEQNHIKYYPADPQCGEAHIDYIVEMDKDSDLYMYLPTKYERNCNVWVLDEEEYINGDGTMDFAGQFFVGDNYSILNLGKFLKNQDVRIRVTIDNDDNEAYWCDTLFYSFDFAQFETDAETLQSKGLTITSFDDTSLSGECYAQESGQYLFTTIPDEPGWTVKVNGREVSTKKSAGALITIPLEKGKNEISMEFRPTYYTGAMIVSAAGLLIILIIFIFEYKNGKILIALVKKAESRERYEKSGPQNTGKTENDQ